MMRDSVRTHCVTTSVMAAIGCASAVGIAGCGLGGLLYGDTSRTLERPLIVQQNEGSSERIRRITKAPSEEVLSALRLRQEWGEPDTIEPGGTPDSTSRRTSHDERWTYQLDRLRWHGGLLILVVLPVPLLVPVGHESVVFTVQDGVVTHATELRSGPKYGGFCGLPLFHILMFQQLPFVCTGGAVRLTDP